jgi:Protein of unknown function (DUF2490)
MTRSFLLHFVSLLSCAQLLAVDFSRDGDFQFWFYVALNKKICQNAKITFEPEFRFGDNASTLYNYYFQSRLYVEANPWLDVAGGYRQQFVRRAIDGKWRTVYSPLADIFLKRTFCKVDFDLRNRIQYAISNRGPALWTYRQRYRFAIPIDTGRFTLRPVIWDEIFFAQRRGFFENRFSIGASVLPGNGLTLTAHYTLRHVEAARRWIKNNVLYLWATYNF